MKSFKIIFALAFIAFAAFYFANLEEDSSNQAPATTSNESQKDSQESSRPSATDNSKDDKADEKKRGKTQAKAGDQKRSQTQQEDELTLKTLAEFEDIPEEHKSSLIQNSKIIKDFAVRETRSDALIEKLRELEARPLVMNDENPYTGSMKVVRTRSPFPGTRYFHAQYFDNEQNEEYVQHMSFEFRPGAQSFEAVKKSIKTAFKLGEPLEDKEDFISWRQGDDYIVWIKKMELSDMKDDPFNAYSKEDVGTIRVAKELEIHDQSPSFHMQQGEPEEN